MNDIERLKFALKEIRTWVKEDMLKKQDIIWIVDKALAETRQSK
ncbi:MAG: hypothetical protein AAF228_01010 [Pseudomonadota bacterium]